MASKVNIYAQSFTCEYASFTYTVFNLDAIKWAGTLYVTSLLPSSHYINIIYCLFSLRSDLEQSPAPRQNTRSRSVDIFSFAVKFVCNSLWNVYPSYDSLIFCDYLLIYLPFWIYHQDLRRNISPEKYKYIKKGSWLYLLSNCASRFRYLYLQDSDSIKFW